MKKLFFMLFTAIFLFANNVITKAQPDDDVVKDKIQKKLNLTDEQKNKISDLRITHQKNMIELKANLEKSQLDMKEYLAKGNIERSKVLSLEDKISKNRDVIRKAITNHRMDVYELLDTNQKKVWTELRADRPFGFGQRFGHHFGRKFGGFRNRICW